MHKKFIATALIAAIATLTGCTTTPKQSGALQTIKVGVISPLSGPAATYGEQMQRILDSELPKVNADIAPLGYELKLVYEDGKCTGADALTSYQKLTDIDSVHFILGGTCSSESMALTPHLEKKKTLALSSLSSNPNLEGSSPYFFSLSYSDDGIAKKIAAELGKFKKVAIITEQNDYNQALEKSVIAELTASHPDTRIVSNESFAKGSDEFRNILQKIKQTEPEMLFINPNPGTTTKALVRQLSEMRDWNVEKIGNAALMPVDVLALAPQTLEGMHIIDAPKVNTPEFLTLISDIEKSKGTLGDLGNYYSAATIDALHLLGEVIAKSEANPEVARTLIASEKFTGYLGSLHFDNHTYVQGIGQAHFVVHKGKIELAQ